jgi:acyl-CoA thioester hydrolase
MEHRVSYKVYYEDTDSLGMVYYANYLRYLERGRTELVNSLGRDIRDWNNDGYYFVVYSVNIRYRKPAELGDLIDVVSAFSLPTPYRALFRQRVERDGELLGRGRCRGGLPGGQPRPAKIPRSLAARLARHCRREYRCFCYTSCNLTARVLILSP